MSALAKKMEAVGKITARRACNDPTDPVAYQADLGKHCKALSNLTLEQWGLFKRALPRRWSDRVDVLTQLYRAHASWVRLLQDKQAWDK